MVRQINLVSIVGDALDYLERTISPKLEFSILALIYWMSNHSFLSVYFLKYMLNQNTSHQFFPLVIILSNQLLICNLFAIHPMKPRIRTNMHIDPLILDFHLHTIVKV